MLKAFKYLNLANSLFIGSLIFILIYSALPQTMPFRPQYSKLKGVVNNETRSHHTFYDSIGTTLNQLRSDSLIKGVKNDNVNLQSIT